MTTDNNNEGNRVSQFNLNMHTARLLMNEPFFAALSRKIDKRPSTEISTAGVRIDEESGQFEMLYNPEFFENLPDDHKLGVLKHEFYHLIFEHVTGRLPEQKMTMLWNVATDLAINSHIATELPDVALVPGRGDYLHLDGFKSAEWYFEALKKEEEDKKENDDGKGGEGQEGQEQEAQGSGKEQQQSEGEENNSSNGSGSGNGEPQTLDDHSGWGKASKQAKEIAKQRLKEHLRKSADEANKANNWGSVSNSMKKKILTQLHATLDWKKVLRYFVKTSQKANKSSSIKRINRRYAYIHPGRKVQRQAKIAISIDQSGSVDDKMLAAFYAELNKLSDIAEFTVIPFDSEVFEEKIYVWKKGEKRKKERVLCGGTCFNAPTKYVNEHNFDGHIVLTDMYAPKPKRSNCQRMWMTTEHNARYPYFQTNERVIAITD